MSRARCSHVLQDGDRPGYPVQCLRCGQEFRRAPRALTGAAADAAILIDEAYADAVRRLAALYPDIDWENS